MKILAVTTLSFLVTISSFAAQATCKLLIQPTPTSKFEVVAMTPQSGEIGQLGLLGTTDKFIVVVNGSSDLSDLNVQIKEVGNSKYFLSVNGAKGTSGEVSIGTNVRGHGIALTCKE